MILEGRYGPPKPMDRVPVGDGAGDVIAVGEQVTDVAVGDRVSAAHFTKWIDGEYDPSIFEGDCSAIWLAVGNCALTGQRMREAAGNDVLPVRVGAGCGWHYGLASSAGIGRIKAGDTVLKTPGMGGVSILALQIAKLNGARVVITSSSDEKL